MKKLKEEGKIYKAKRLQSNIIKKKKKKKSMKI